MEILAPAGSREAVYRAQAAGADAVYLGYAAFSARAGADNFDEQALAETVRYAHLHHMRVYVTVNTLVKDGEMQEVRNLLGLLSRLPADGVLVQDLGVLRLAGKAFPELRIHASTQMAIHNATGVLWSLRRGMKRVVLARECSLDEIRACAETGVEIEVFAHGAQCVSVSGECLFSSMVGERSGNRGRCAQPCRKMYRFDGKEGAWLSPRDLCLRDEIPALAEAGAASLKIEGRLKRPEYVYTVTDSYRRGRDLFSAGSFQPASPGEREDLMQIFHRGGFMTGYAFGAEDAGVIQPKGVNHQGIRVGKVVSRGGNLARVRLEKPLHNGDGLRITGGSLESEMTYAGPETPAGETAVVRLREGQRCREGDEVFRLTDAARLAGAMAAPQRRIPVRMALRAFPGEPLQLRAGDGETEALAEGEICEAARSRETAGEEMARQLRKTGGTDFEAEEVSVETAGAYVPLARVNELRRRALQELAERRIARFERSGREPEASGPEETRPAARRAAVPGTLVTVRNGEQAAACRGEDTLIIWYPEDFRTEALERLLEEIKPGDWLRLPEVCEEGTLREIHRLIAQQRDRLGGVLLGSVGQLGCSWPVPVAAGPGIPVMNRDAAALLAEEGCSFAMASPELTGEETKRLIGRTGDASETEREDRTPGKQEDPMPVAVQVYGRTQLMLLHHCPARTVQGWRQGHAECALCDRRDPRALRGKELTDERGYRFPLLRTRLPEGCLVRLMNTVPTNLADQRIGGIRAFEMTAETPEEAAEVIRLARRYERAGESTRGHWNRPVL